MAFAACRVDVNVDVIETGAFFRSKDRRTLSKWGRFRYPFAMGPRVMV